MRKKKFLSIIMSVIMILTMVPAVAFAASAPYYLEVYTYNDEGEFVEVGETGAIVESGKIRPTDGVLLDELKKIQGVDKFGITGDTTADDFASVKYYGVDQLSKLKKGKSATEYGFTKATLSRDHLLCVYDLKETDGTVNFNIYTNRVADEPTVTITKECILDTNTYEEIEPSRSEIKDALAEFGIPEDGKSLTFVSEWMGDSAWADYAANATEDAFDMSQIIDNDGSLNMYVRQDTAQITVTVDGDDESYEYGKTVGDITDPDKTDWTFEGWSEDGTKDGIVAGDTVLEDGMELTSVWSRDVKLYLRSSEATGSVYTATIEDETVYLGERLPDAEDVFAGYITENDKITKKWIEESVWLTVYNNDYSDYENCDEVTEAQEEAGYYVAVYVPDGNLEEYTVSYDFNSGSPEFGVNSEYTVTEGKEATLLDDTSVILNGWTLAGWTDEDGNEYVPGEIVEVTDDISLTAKWTKNVNVYIHDYAEGLKDGVLSGDTTLYSKTDGGLEVVLGESLKDIDAYVEELAESGKWADYDSSRDTIYGWFDGTTAQYIAGGITELEDAVAIDTADVNIGDINILVWKDKTAETHTVTLVSDGETSDYEIIDGHYWGQDIGGDFTDKVTAPSGWTLEGWFDEEGNQYNNTTPITSDVVLTAKWTRDVTLYVVTDDSSNSKQIPYKVTKGQDLPTPESVFIDLAVTADDTLAYWFDQETWTASFNDLKALVAEGNTVTDADGGSPEYAAVILTEGNLADVTVTFDLNGGQGTANPINTKAGKPVSEPATPTKDNREFAGWYDVETGEKFDFAQPVAEDVDLIAKWNRKVKFNLFSTENGGVGTPLFSTDVIVVDENFTLENIEQADLENAVYADYIDSKRDLATGWFDFSVFTANKNSVENLKAAGTITDLDQATTNYGIYSIYAIVENDANVDYKTVTFMNGENTYEVANIETGTAIGAGELPQADPTKDKRVFAGWYTEDGTEVTAETVVTEDMTAYAEWNVKVDVNLYKDNFTSTPGRIVQTQVEVSESNIAEELENIFNNYVETTEYDAVYKWYSLDKWNTAKNSNENKFAVLSGLDKVDLDKIDDIASTSGNYSSNIGFRLFAMVETDANAVTVSFDNVTHADAVEPQKIVKGTGVSVELTGVEDKYQLEGWYNGSEKVDLATATFDEDTTLRAKWQAEVTYKIYSNGDFTNTEDETEWVTLKISEGTGKIEKDVTYGWYDEADWKDLSAPNSEFDWSEFATVKTITGPVTLYGMNVSELKVTFGVENGVKVDADTMPANETVDYGEKVSAEAQSKTPVRTNDSLKFAGWVVKGEEDNGVVDLANYAITKDTTFVATWEGKEYSVKFVNENSDVSEFTTEDVTVVYGDTVVAPVAEPKDADNYAFEGWYTTANFEDGTKVDVDALVYDDAVYAENNTLYARWSVKVTYNLYNASTTISPEKVLTEFVPIGAQANLGDKANEVELGNGVKLYGWFSEAIWEKVVSNQIPNFAAKWDDYNLEYGKFAVTEPVTVYGKYAEAFTVSFDPGEVIIAENMPGSYTVLDGEYITEPTEIPTAEGYVFTGWDYNFDKAVTGNTVITALWNKAEYVITYDANGGTFNSGVVTTKSISYGDNYGTLLNKNSVSRAGFTFLGWSKDADSKELVKSTDIYDLYENSTLYAVWDASTVEVTYVTNGGVVKNDSGEEITTEVVDFESVITREAEKAGLKFEGWYLNEDLTEKYEATPITANTTLYAKYEAEITFAVYENDTDTARLAEKTVDFDEHSEITSPTVEELGVTLGDTDEFFGWYTEAEFNNLKAGETAVKFEGNATEGMTLYAKVLRHYTVTFDTDGGSDVESQDVAFKGYATKPDDPTKEGHKFVGWKDEYGNDFDFDKTIITQDRTIKAEWARAGYTVTFVTEPLTTGDGWTGSTVTVKYNCPVTSTVESEVDNPDNVPKDENMIRTGYTFTGWYLDGELYNLDTPVTESIELVAGWRLNEFTAEIVNGPFVYSGAMVQPDIKVTDKVTGEDISESVGIVYDEAEIEGNDNAFVNPDGNLYNAGIYTATITPKADSDYCEAEAVVLTFEVEAADISTNKYEVYIESPVVMTPGEPNYVQYDPENLQEYTYNGKEIKPSVDIGISGTFDSLKPTDYEVEYADNINAGTATITLTGKGNYTGELVLHFVIERAQIDIAPYYVTIEPTYYTFDGTAKQPSVTVRPSEESDTVLEYGKDYNVGYIPPDGVELVDGQPVYAGVYKVVVEGIGNYAGTTNSQPDFRISTRKISSEEITVTLDKTEWEYTGKAIKPEVTVTDGLRDGLVLTEGVDYTVEYTSNTEPGTATIMITGTGNYSETRTVEFEITSKVPAVYYTTGIVRYTDGTPIVGVTVTLNGTTADGEMISMSTKTNNAGRYYFTDLSDGNYTVTYKGRSVKAVLNPGSPE